MNDQTETEVKDGAVGRSDSNVGLGIPQPDTNAQDIVRDWLKLNGFGGLVHDDSGCGCHLDELIICGECFSECRPAYKHIKANGEYWMHTNKHWVESEDDEA